MSRRFVSRRALQGTRIDGVRADLHSAAFEKIVSKASHARQIGAIVVNVREIRWTNRPTDDAIENRLKEIAHLRSKFFGRDRIDNNVHRVIEIHQDNAEDLDERENELQVRVALGFGVLIDAEKDHDGRC